MSKPVLTIDIEEKTGVGAWTLIEGATLSRVTGASWEYVSNGNYGTASVAIERKWNEAGALALSTGTEKRLVFRLDGSPVAYALLRRPVRTFDAIQTIRIEAIGPTDACNKVIVKRSYAPPGGSADLSWHYHQLVSDFILPRGFADRASIEVIGIQKGRIVFDGTLREALTDLGELADSFVYWGFEMAEDKTVTFFVRKRDPDAAPLYAPVAAQNDYDLILDRYAPVVASLEHIEEDRELVNALYIEGGEVRYPNFVENPSFEEVLVGSGAASDLLKNGNFDGDNQNAWTTYGGGSIKTEAEDPSHTGTKHLEMDNPGEGARQTAYGILPARVYGIDLWAACENPTLGTYSAVVRFKWLYGASALPVRTDETTITTRAPAGAWEEKRISQAAPDTADRVIVEIEAVGIEDDAGNPVAMGTERGILIDTVSFFSQDETYQRAWRLESTPTPRGEGDNANPFGLYYAIWDALYLNDESPGEGYGDRYVAIKPFGLGSGGSGKYLRLIQAQDADMDVQEKRYYTAAILAWADDGNGVAPEVVYPDADTLRLGLIWWGSDPAAPNAVYVKNVRLTATPTVYGFSYQLPAGAQKSRLFLEMTRDLLYRFDGAYFGQSPVVPEEFQLGRTYKTKITVADLYPASDPRVLAMADPPNGYGPLEEKVESDLVIDRQSALDYAKPIFDERALPRVSESLKVIQVDSPLTLYKTDGYFQLSGAGDLAGFSFPKLWPARIAYSYDDQGVVAEIELEKETPKTEQFLKRDRALAITQVGDGTDPNDVYLPPTDETFVLVADDLPAGLAPKVTDNGDGTETLRLDLSESILVGSGAVEVSYNGLDVPDSWLAFETASVGGELQPRRLALTLPSGDTFAVDDEILVFHRSAAGKIYAPRVVYGQAASGGAETFVLPEEPLAGSVRAYRRERRVRGDQVLNLLDSATGKANLVSFDAGAELMAGDDVIFRYDAPLSRASSIYVQEGVLDASGKITLVAAPYQFADAQAKTPGDPKGYSVLVSYGGLYQKLPDIETDIDGTLYVVAPSDRVGDRYVVRITL